MPMIQISDKDMLRGKVYTPGWYTVHIEQIGEKLAKNQESTNYVVEGTILRNADDGSEDFAKHPLEWNFNSKAMGFVVGFLTALGVEVQSNKRYDLSAFAGRNIDVYVENDLYEGRQVNRVNHKYRAVRDVE